jgi:hypothetical protein
MDNPLLGAGGAALWLLGPPVIHLSHDEKGRAAASLDGMVIGFVVGVLAANALDAIIAREDEDPAATTMFTIGGGF